MTEATPAGQQRLRRALAALELAALRHRRRVRIDDHELAALLHLAGAGAVAQGRLAELTGLSRSGAGALVARLADGGFVQRRIDPGDRRRRLVELSPAGRRRLRAAYAPLEAATHALAAERPAAQLEALAELLERLVDVTGALDAEPAAPAPRPAAAEVPIWRRWG